MIREKEDLLTVRAISVAFPGTRSLAAVLARRPAPAVRAVESVDLRLAAGETLGIVGESGCGKTTLGRAILGLAPSSAGEIFFSGRTLESHMSEDPMAFRRQAQMIFQDPMGSLNPKMTVYQTLAEVLRVHGLATEGADTRHQVAELLSTVGMPAELMDRRPRALSGGQCQRVGIARALAVRPKLIVADESVSALDVSVQAQILNLLVELQRRHHLAMIFISHDLTVVRHLCQRVAVMYLGRIVEEGPTASVFDNPRHPYTQALLAAKPRLGGASLAELELLQGEPPSPLSVPAGCAFHPRCPHVMEACRRAPVPPLRPLESPSPGLPGGAVGRDGAALSVACRLYDEEPAAFSPADVPLSEPRAGLSNR